MKIGFFGSSEFSVPFIDAFKKEIVFVATSIDKIRGRGKNLTANTVRKFSEEVSLHVIKIEKFEASCYNEMKSFNPDILLVVSYGKIIPQEVLGLTNCSLNLHPSKLPLYRGAAPIERQIMDGVEDSAVSIIKIIKELDAGDIILDRAFKILPFETKGDVERKIVGIGVPLLKEAIKLVSIDRCEGRKQKGPVSYANKITKEDEIIDWKADGLVIYNKIRALSPKPGAYTYFRGKLMKIYSAEFVGTSDLSVPYGTIFDVSKDYFYITCKNANIKVLELQVEGGKRLKARDFINGFKILNGEKFSKI